jgi:hypothetical protein
MVTVTLYLELVPHGVRLRKSDIMRVRDWGDVYYWQIHVRIFFQL